MMQYVFSLCISFAVAVVVLPVVIRVARRNGWFDRLDGRKIHSGEIPRLGGVGIYLAVMAGAVVGIAALAHADARLHLRFVDWLFFFGGLSAMFAVGLIDDFNNIPALRKLAGQIAAAVAISLSGFRIETVQVLFGGPTVSLGLLSYAVTVLWIVAIANSVNLIDGMDGFAGGVVLIASTTFAAIGAMRGDEAVMILSLTVFGASAAFLLYNRPPAQIFMGDSGSLLLGTLLAVIPLLRGVGVSARPALNLVIPATVLLIPILDTASAILRRLRRHQPIHTPDSEHLHHKLLRLFGSTRGALSVLYVYQVGLGAAAVACVYLSPVLGGVLAIMVWLFSIAIIATTHSYYLKLMDVRALKAGSLEDYLSGSRGSSKAI